MDNNEEKKNTRKNIIIIILVIIIIILLYLLIRRFGNIEHHSSLTPTGNVDIFEIECTCCDDKDDDSKTNDDTQPVFNEDDINKNKSGSSEKQNRDIKTNEDIVVFDNYKMWDNKKLRIFSNPAYEYENKIAPGSNNSYVFKIRNKNNFDVLVDISFDVENTKNINMKYKLRSEGNYLIGSDNNYENIDNKVISKIKIPAKSEKTYILDWKWIDSDNDTQVGFDINANYKLSINVGANQK